MEAIATLRPGDGERMEWSQRSWFCLHLLRVGAVTTLAARGEVSQRVIQRGGRWKSSEFSKVYTHNNPEDAGMVSRKLAETVQDRRSNGSQAKVLYGAEHRVVTARPWSCVWHWLATIGCLRRPSLRMLEPLRVGPWGGTLGFWQYDGRLEYATDAAALVSRR